MAAFPKGPAFQDVKSLSISESVLNKYMQAMGCAGLSAQCIVRLAFEFLSFLELEGFSFLLCMLCQRIASTFNQQTIAAVQGRLPHFGKPVPDRKLDLEQRRWRSRQDCERRQQAIERERGGRGGREGGAVRGFRGRGDSSVGGRAGRGRPPVPAAPAAVEAVCCVCFACL